MKEEEIRTEKKVAEELEVAKMQKLRALVFIENARVAEMTNTGGIYKERGAL